MNNPNTDWFRSAGWGVFVHYLGALQNEKPPLNQGRITRWDACVNELNVDAVARQLSEAGVKYLIFTVMQIYRWMCSPNKAYSSYTGYAPGEACSTRDLILDLYNALDPRGIRPMLYWTGDGPRLDGQASAGLGWDGSPTDTFLSRWTEVAREYSDRYGERVAGWWVDGCYESFEGKPGYTQEKLGLMSRALKHGNPKAIVALNSGVSDSVRAYSPEHEDYTCGEQNDFTCYPESRWIHGEQWHVLSFLGASWAEPSCRHADQGLIDYVRKCNSRGGVVTLDAAIYRDGTISGPQLAQLKALRQGLRR